MAHPDRATGRPRSVTSAPARTRPWAGGPAPVLELALRPPPRTITHTRSHAADSCTWHNARRDSTRTERHTRKCRPPLTRETTDRDPRGLYSDQSAQTDRSQHQQPRPRSSLPAVERSYKSGGCIDHLFFTNLQVNTTLTRRPAHPSRAPKLVSCSPRTTREICTSAARAEFPPPLTQGHAAGVSAHRVRASKQPPLTRRS